MTAWTDRIPIRLGGTACSHEEQEEEGEEDAYPGYIAETTSPLSLHAKPNPELQLTHSTTRTRLRNRRIRAIGLRGVCSQGKPVGRVAQLPTSLRRSCAFRSMRGRVKVIFKRPSATGSPTGHGTFGPALTVSQKRPPRREEERPLGDPRARKQGVRGEEGCCCSFMSWVEQSSEGVSYSVFDVRAGEYGGSGRHWGCEVI